MHWIDVKHVRMFVAVAELSSFTKAAEKLNIAQPWLSVQIRKLEDSVGFQLFLRGRKQLVELSAKGQSLLPAAREFLEAHQKLADAATMVRRGEVQQLVIGAPEFSVDVPERHELLADLAEDKPLLEIDIHNGYSNTLLEKMRANELDVAFILGPMDMPDMETIAIASTDVALLLPAQHRLAQFNRIPVAELFGETISNFRRKFNTVIYDRLAEIFLDHGVTMSFCPEASAMGVRHHVMRHNVPVLATEWFRGSLASLDDMVLRPVDGTGLIFDLLLARRKGDRRPAVEALWKAAHAMALPPRPAYPPAHAFLSKEQQIDIRSHSPA